MRKYIGICLLLFILSACSSNTSAQPPSKESPSEDTEQVEVEVEEKSGTYDKPIIKEVDVSIVPERITIPSIGVDAFVEKVGVLPNGQMGVPEDEQNAAWFQDGAKPGAKGSAVIAGHVGVQGDESVFYHLQDLQKGDEIIVTGENGESRTFVVTGRDVFPQDDAPVEEIFGYTARKTLKLITCTGEFIRSQGGHQDRLVVYSVLKEEM